MSAVIDVDSESHAAPTVYTQPPLKYRHNLVIECLQEIHLLHIPEHQHTQNWREWLEQQFTRNRTGFSWYQPSSACLMSSISWSATNLLALSAIERPPTIQTYRGSESESEKNGQEGKNKPSIPFGCVQHPLFIMHPTFPWKFVTVNTPHYSPIKFIKWCEPSCGLLLLTADQEKICVWKMEVYLKNLRFFFFIHLLKSSVDNWKCQKTWDIDCVVAVDWIHCSNQVIFSI